MKNRGVGYWVLPGPGWLLLAYLWIVLPLIMIWAAWGLWRMIIELKPA